MTAFLIINLILTVLSVIVLLKTRLEYRESVSQYDLRYIKWKDVEDIDIAYLFGQVNLFRSFNYSNLFTAGLIGYLLNNYYDPETDYDEENYLLKRCCPKYEVVL